MVRRRAFIECGGYRRGFLQTKDILPKTLKSPCAACRTDYFTIHPSGKLYKCDRKMLPEKSIGDVANYDFAELTKKTKSWPGVQVEERCKKCALLPLCRNGCNLSCKHCYEGKIARKKNFIMSAAILEKSIKLIQANYKFVKYSWNGTLLNLERINFISDNNFNLSISYDAQFNDVLRQQTALVEENLNLLRRCEKPFNILCTVHSKNYRQLIEMYEFLKKYKCGLKFNPIFPSGNARDNAEYLIEPEAFAQEMYKFFCYWLDDASAAPVSNFIHYIKLFLKLPGRPCIYSGCLYKMPEIEPDGAVMPCSRYSDNGCVISNINEVASIQEIFDREEYKALVRKSIMRRKKCKEQCALYRYCLGGCTSAAFNEGDVENNQFGLCKITRALFPQIFSILSAREAELKIANPIFFQLLKRAKKLPPV